MERAKPLCFSTKEDLEDVHKSMQRIGGTGWNPPVEFQHGNMQLVDWDQQSSGKM